MDLLGNIRKLRILHLLKGEGKAGSHISALNIAKGLKQRGHYVVVGCPINSYTAQLAKKLDLEIINLALNSYFDIKSIFCIIKVATELRIDIINSHLSTDRILAILSRPFLKNKTKIILTRRNMPAKYPLIKGFFYAKGADAIICVSKAIKRRLQENGIEETKLKVIYNGIEEDWAKKVNREQTTLLEKYGLIKKEIKIVGVVSRLVKLRSNPILFSALEYLPKNIKLLLVGQGEEYIKNYIHKYNDRIITCGWQEDILPYYKIMDILCLPTKGGEGLPRVILEAMAAEVPIIASNVEGVDEIIEDGKNGFLFENNSPKMLADKINNLIQDDELKQRFIKEAKCRLQFFYLSKIVEQTEKVYYETLNC